MEKEYGENVHRYLFEKGLAPELYGVKPALRGCWKAIFMDLLPGTSLHSLLEDTVLDIEKRNMSGEHQEHIAVCSW